MNKDVLRVISQILGIILLITWSFCNIPQFVLNHQRKSVKGLSVTFVVLNQIGFLYYAIYAIYGYQYQKSHPDVTQNIVWEDWMWSSISCVITWATAVQLWVYRHTISETINPFYKVTIVALIVIGVVHLPLAMFGIIPWFSPEESGAYSFAHVLGYCKSFISALKYIPQVTINWRRKSTQGFSIIQVLMDLGGGLCSFFQAYINSHIDTHPNGDPDYSNIFGNIPKLVLNLESTFFTTIFVVQHYILYNDRHMELVDQEESGDDEEQDLSPARGSIHPMGGGVGEESALMKHSHHASPTPRGSDSRDGNVELGSYAYRDDVLP